MIHLLNAFSLGMLDGQSAFLRFSPVPITSVRAQVAREGVQSHIGHADTAALLSALLDADIPMIRDGFSFVTLPADDAVIVAQYNGTRLQEGATSLPDGARIVFFEVVPAACEVCDTPFGLTIVCGDECARKVAY